jgi:predicted metalloprotease
VGGAIRQTRFYLIISGTSSGGPAVQQSSPGSVQDPGEAIIVQFASFVLDDAQKTWESLLPQKGTPYRHAKLVLFRDETDSPCGLAQSATGPLYSYSCSALVLAFQAAA